MKLATRLGIGIDDYLIVAASVIIGYVMISGTYGKLSTAVTTPLISADWGSDVLVLGMGVHTFNVEPSKRFPNDVLYWLDEIAYQIAMALVKSSILCFYVGSSESHLSTCMLTLEAQDISRSTLSIRLLYDAWRRRSDRSHLHFCYCFSMHSFP